MFSIDSCMLWLRMENVTIINKKISSRIISFYENTKELHEVGKYSNYLNEKTGIKTVYKIKNLFGVDYLTVLLNSKMLKQRYFEGITLNNYQVVISYINSLNDIKILSLNESFISDVDIKKDFNMIDLEFINYLKNIKTLVLPQHNTKMFTSEMNTGLMINSRENNTITKPYVKYYSKGNELQTQSKIFNDIYLGHYNLNLRRLEINIKNKSHLVSYMRFSGYSDFKELDLFAYLNIIENHSEDIWKKVKIQLFQIDIEIAHKRALLQLEDMKMLKGHSLRFFYIYEYLRSKDISRTSIENSILPILYLTEKNTYYRHLNRLRKELNIFDLLIEERQV